MDTGSRIKSGRQKSAGTAFATVIVLLASCGGGGSAPTSSPLVLSPAAIALDPGTSHQFTASGGQPPYSYTLSGPGSIDSQSGTYSAPDTAGNATVNVSDRSGASAQSAVTINPSLTMTPTALAVGTSVKLTGQGGSPPYVLNFKSGIGSFDPSSGIYTAPTIPGTATVAITDSQSVTTQVQITVNPALSIIPAALTMTASSSQTYQVTGVGGGAGYTYSIVSGSGTVDANGVYTAGTSIGRDVLQVRDAQGATATAQVQLLRADTNGPVNALIVDPAGTYLGGSFTAVHPYVTSRIAAVDPVTGHPNLGCDLGTGFDSTVRTILVVGNSLYVGGDFTNYKGQPAHALAKLDANTCALDSNFTQDVGFDGHAAPYPGLPPPTTVTALASGGSFLYVGGDFSTYRQAPAGGVAKLDLSSGQLDTTFTQANGVDGAVTAIAASADAVFLAGLYQHYRGTDVGLPHGFPIKLSAVSGDMDPTFNLPPIQGGVASAMIVSSPWLYVAGNFAPGIQKLDLQSGAADPIFAQNTGIVPGAITSVALSGNALFLAGTFASIGGVPAQNIAKVDALSGKVDPTFNRASAADRVVWAVAANSSSVYIAGDFQNYAGHAAPGFARLDAVSGALDTAFGLPGGFSGGTPTSLAVSSESVYAGGYIVTYGGTPAAHIARFDPVTGTEDTQFLAAGGPDDGFVTKMLLASQTLYVGGNFSSYAGVPAGMLVKLDSRTGTPDSAFSQGAGFSRDPTYPGYGGVDALALSASSLYVGGFFTSYRGQPVSALAKLNTASGSLDTVFNQTVGFTEVPGGGLEYNPMGVTALALTPDALYVAGNFAGYRGTQRYLLAKLDPISGNLDAQFVPATGLVFIFPYAPVTFNTLLISGNSLYAGGGSVQLIGGPFINGLAKFDATTGSVDASFVQTTGVIGSTTSNGPVVSDLALAGSSLYVGGYFACNIGGLTFAYNLAKFDATTGKVDKTFTQAGGPEFSVFSLLLQPDSLLISGSFDTYRGNFAGYSAALDLTTGGDLDVPVLR